MASVPVVDPTGRKVATRDLSAGVDIEIKL